MLEAFALELAAWLDLSVSHQAQHPSGPSAGCCQRPSRDGSRRRVMQITLALKGPIWRRGAEGSELRHPLLFEGFALMEVRGPQRTRQTVPDCSGVVNIEPESVRLSPLRVEVRPCVPVHSLSPAIQSRVAGSRLLALLRFLLSLLCVAWSSVRNTVEEDVYSPAPQVLTRFRTIIRRGYLVR